MTNVRLGEKRKKGGANKKGDERTEHPFSKITFIFVFKKRSIKLNSFGV